MRKNYFRQLSIFLCILFCGILLFPEPAHAGYLDSGTGSTLVQGIIAIVAGIKRFFGKLFGGKGAGDK